MNRIQKALTTGLVALATIACAPSAPKEEPTPRTIEKATGCGGYHVVRKPIGPEADGRNEVIVALQRPMIVNSSNPSRCYFLRGFEAECGSYSVIRERPQAFFDQIEKYLVEEQKTLQMLENSLYDR